MYLGVLFLYANWWYSHCGLIVLFCYWFHFDMLLFGWFFIWPIVHEHNPKWPIPVLLYLLNVAYHNCKKYHTTDAFEIFFEPCSIMTLNCMYLDLCCDVQEQDLFCLYHSWELRYFRSLLPLTCRLLL